MLRQERMKGFLIIRNIIRGKENVLKKPWHLLLKQQKIAFFIPA